MQESIGALFNSPEMLAVLSLVVSAIVYKFLEAHITIFVSRKMGSLLFAMSVYDRGMTIRHDTSTGPVNCKIADVDSKNVWLDYGEVEGGACMKPIPMAIISSEMTKWAVLNYAPKQNKKAQK